jgi:hypothetical protein
MVNRINLNSPMRSEFNLRSALVLDPYTQVLPSWVNPWQLGAGAFRHPSTILQHRR